MKINRYLLAATLASIPGLAFTATQGTLGENSTGTSVINLVKETSVLISDVDDITFPITGGIVTTPSTESDGVCVFSSTGNYDVTITSANGTAGANPEDDFILTNTTQDATIPYSVTWDVGQSGNPVTHGQTITGLVGNSTATDCGGPGNTNAEFSVSITAAAFNLAPAGSYSDTISILVAVR